MKLQSNRILESLSLEDVKNLTKEVKETLCSDFKNNGRKIFSSAELWKIQRERKNIVSRKFYGY